MDNIKNLHQYGTIAMQRWDNYAVGATTLPRNVELSACHIYEVLVINTAKIQLFF